MKNKSIFLILLILVMCGCSEGTANDSSVPVQGPAVFLASDASDFVNGHILYVDGGILANIGKQL